MSMTIYWMYLLIGFAIAMPVGAISVEMIKQGLKHGFMHGWAVGIGGMTVDVLLIVALYFGLANVLALPYIQLPLWLIGAVFLGLVAYDSIRQADNDITLAGEKPVKSFKKTYATGLLVAISPGSLVFWVSVFGTALSNSYATGKGSFLIVALGILSGIVLHDIGLLTIVSYTRKVMNRRAIKISSIIAGLILLVFAAYFLYQFIVGVKAYL